MATATRNSALRPAPNRAVRYASPRTSPRRWTSAPRCETARTATGPNRAPSRTVSGTGSARASGSASGNAGVSGARTAGAGAAAPSSGPAARGADRPGGSQGRGSHELGSHGRGSNDRRVNSPGPGTAGPGPPDAGCSGAGRPTGSRAVPGRGAPVAPPPGPWPWPIVRSTDSIRSSRVSEASVPPAEVPAGGPVPLPSPSSPPAPEPSPYSSRHHQSSSLPRPAPCCSMGRIVPSCTPPGQGAKRALREARPAPFRQAWAMRAATERSVRAVAGRAPLGARPRAGAAGAAA